MERTEKDGEMERDGERRSCKDSTRIMVSYVSRIQQLTMACEKKKVNEEGRTSIKRRTEERRKEEGRKKDHRFVKHVRCDTNFRGRGAAFATRYIRNLIIARLVTDYQHRVGRCDT